VRFKHSYNLRDKHQTAFTDIEVELDIDETVKLLGQLKIAKLVELKMKLDTLVSEHTDKNNIHLRGGNDSILIAGEGTMQVDMDYLVENMEFDEYIHKYLVDCRFIVLRKPEYLFPLIEFTESIEKMAEKFKREYAEDILGGEL
jgi:hypothetical protein